MSTSDYDARPPGRTPPDEQSPDEGPSTPVVLWQRRTRPAESAAHVEWALWYASFGFRVFPVFPPTVDGICSCTDEHCPKPGKHPGLKKWQVAASADPGQIREWWKGRRASFSIGIATGRESNLLVLDADGDAGATALRDHVMPRAPRSQSGRVDGGGHYFFRWPEGLDAKATIAGLEPGLDSRGEGGYVVVAPSLHKSGARYRWVLWPDDVPMPEPPMWLVQKLSEGPAVRKIVSGDRNNTIFYLARRLRARGASPDLVARLALHYNAERLQEPLPEEEVRATVSSACRPEYVAGPDPFRDFQVEGLPEPDPSLPILIDAPLTDGGNAACFAAVYSDAFRYVPTWRQWYRWNGTVWAEDTSGAHRAAVFMVLRARGLAAALEDDAGRRDVLEDWARKSDSKRASDAAVDIAQAIPVLVAGAEWFDNQPWLLVTPSETIDLLTQQPRACRRSDYITKTFGVSLDRAATCPAWEQFLVDIFSGDMELVGYVQRFIGHALTGSTKEQIFSILNGGGSNGKSTFVSVLKALFGEYARSARWSTFDSDNRKGVGDDLAALRGARLVTVPEADEQSTLNEARVKMISGGDEISCRHLYGRDFNYRPEYKILAMTNELPRVRGTNRGIWRRLKPIPFTRVFEGASKDPDMEEKLLAELPGIFNWALDGLREYLAHGLEDPASVQAAVRAYKQESSPVQRFVKESLEFGPDKEVEAGTALFEAFKGFCEMEGIKYTVTKNKFGMDFRNILENDYPHCPVSEPRQVNRGKGKRPYIRVGVGIKEEYDRQEHLERLTGG